jgi:hypothetical protein
LERRKDCDGDILRATVDERPRAGSSGASFLILYFCFLAFTLLLSACASSKPTIVKAEPLNVPPAPPRVISPAPEPPEEPTEPEPVPPLPRTSRPAARETAPPKVEPRVSETPPQPSAETPVTPPPNPAPAPAAEGTPELKTAGTPDDAKASREVRDTLDRAGRLLNSIDYRVLSNASKLQYDMAKRFIEQSEEAVKARNYVAAKLMAEKAETIGKELGGH